MNMLKRLASLLLISFVAACGGGGGDAGNSPFEPDPDPNTPQATNLVLQLDKSTVGNSGSDGVVVTVTATDENSNVVSGAPVTIAADKNAVVIAGASSTGADGVVEATVLSGTENRANRTVTVTATSGALKRTATFQVIGAKINSTIVGSPYAPGAAGQVNYVLVDVNSNPMVDQPITVTALGTTVTGTTDISGAYVYTFKAPGTAGSFPISATAGGFTKEEAASVAVAGSVGAVPAGSILSASVSANPSVISVNTSTTSNQSAIRALFLGPKNAPIKNVRVRFDLAGDANSIGGTFTTGSSIVYSTETGEATTAYVAGPRFSPTDGVTIRACYGYTDADVAGTNCAHSATATLTVVSEAISVSIGTDNKLIDNTLTYIQQFVVTVVDSSGRAKPDVQITPSVDLLRFAKGQWIWGGTEWFLAPTQYFYDWTVLDQTPIYLEDPRSLAEQISDAAGAPEIDSRAACWNEDRNRNGVLEAAEDTKAGVYSLAAGGNGNGKLDPAKSDVAISIPGNSRTDAAGKVVVQIEYAKNLGSWLEYKILVSASGIGGTEGRATWTDVLGVLNGDVKAEAEPAFVVSRYGKLASCSSAQ
jgi:hypothetical protein